MPAMRILEIVDVRWWNACAYYGLELTRALRAAGEDAVVAASPGSPPAVRAQALGLPVWTGGRFADPNPLRAAASLPALVRCLHGFDVIDAHRAEGHVMGALASALWSGPPVVRTRGDVRAPRRDPLNALLHRKLTAAVIVPGDFMRRQLMAGLGLPAPQIEIIPAGIDLEYYALEDNAARSSAAGHSEACGRPPRDRRGVELRRSLGIGDAEPVAGIVARLSPVKGHRILLAALAELAGKGLRPHLLVAGQDSEVRARDLAAEAGAAGLGDRLHWLGYVEDVRPVLAALDVLIVPSLGSEAISRAVLEGMAMARPVVASRVGVIPELVVDGETGWLVPAGDAEALASALAASVREPELGIAMGKRGRLRAEAEYGLGRWVERTRSLYGRVVASHRGSGHTGGGSGGWGGASASRGTDRT